MTIYIESAILENAVLTFTMLYLSARITGCYVGMPRLLAASAVSGGLALLAFIYPYVWMRAAALAVVCAAAAASLRDFKGQALFTLAFVFMNAFVSGFIVVVLTLTDSTYIFTGGYIVYGDAVTPVAPAVAAGLAAAFLIRRWVTSRRLTETAACQLRVGRETCPLDAYIDTGNRLYTPFTHIPAVVIDGDAYDALPKEGSKVRVGCKTLTGSEILCGFVPKCCTVTYRGRTKRVKAALLRAPHGMPGKYKALMNAAVITQF